MGFLAAVFVVPPTSGYLGLCLWVLVLQAAVGVAGFGLHVMADFGPESGGGWWESVVHGAPPFAPLLFCNLAVLAVIGLWDMRCRLLRGAH